MGGAKRERGWQSGLRLGAVSALLAYLMACGGTAVIDSAGSGGSTPTGTSTGPSTGTATTTATGTSTGTPTGTPDCEEMLAALTEVVEVAVTCDPALNTPQCTGATLIRDACGCQLAANDLFADLAADAMEKYAVAEAAGCILDCTACPDPDGPWTCRILPVGTAGTCEPDN